MFLADIPSPRDASRGRQVATSPKLSVILGRTYLNIHDGTNNLGDLPGASGSGGAAEGASSWVVLRARWD